MQIQNAIFLLSLALMLCVLAAFVFVVVKANHQSEFKEVQARAYRVRRGLFILVILGGIFVSLGTTRSLPYAATHGQMTSGTSVNVEGKQWYWVLSEHSVPAGTEVTFNVSSGDVNHGFGIYDSNLRLLAQTQAMPGYTNKLVHRFEQPGNYQLMCMEYCGLVHHGMVADFIVTEPTNNTEL